MDDTLMYDGGAVKALGGGRVGGYLVLFSGPKDPDLEGDYFTKSTDFFIDSGDKRPILYRHGVHPFIKSRQLGKATLTIDDLGVFAEGELELRDKYEKFLYSMAEKGKLGWSSGSMNHLVEKSANGKSFEVISWPIGEASLTPAPVEGRTKAMALKEMATEEEIDFDATIKSLEEKEVEEETPAVLPMEGLPGLKALCEAVSPANITMSEHSNVADAALKELITHGSIFVDAFKGYRVRADRLVEFRFKKDGGHISAAKEESLKSWRDDLSKLRMSIESVEGDIEGTLKLSEITRGQADAADKHAKFLMQQFANLQSTIAKE